MTKFADLIYTGPGLEGLTHWGLNKIADRRNLQIHFLGKVFVNGFQFVCRGPIDTKSTFVQVITCCRITRTNDDLNHLNLIFCESLSWDLSRNIQWKWNDDNLFLQMLYFDNYVVCNINSDGVYKIVTSCFVKIENIAKLPLHKQNKPIVHLSPKISNTHTKWGDDIPFPTGLRRESGGKQLWGV